MSAIVSGIALLIVLYAATMKLRRMPVDHTSIGVLTGWLLGFLLLDVALAGLEMLSFAYEQEESWEVISGLIRSRLAVSYLGIQLTWGALIPAIIIGATGLMGSREEFKTPFRVVAASLVLIGIFAMRWNVVIGGQLFSKSLRGFREYIPTLGGQEGVLVAVVILLLPLVIFSIVTKLLPPWEERAPEAVTGERAPEYVSIPRS
jgi:predicted membrane protein